MSTVADRVFAEVDRQLTDVRASAEALAVKAGILTTLSGVGAALVAARIQQGKDGNLSASLLSLGISVLVGTVLLMPHLTPGPPGATIQQWMSEESGKVTNRILVAKLEALETNCHRLVAMRMIFYFQGVAAVAATVLTLVKTASG